MKQEDNSKGDAVYVEMLRFLGTHPTPKQIQVFKISPEAQARLSDLLEKNGEEGLTESENGELDQYQHVHDIMIWVKAQI
jgi:hypothetical protein